MAAMIAMPAWAGTGMPGTNTSTRWLWVRLSWTGMTRIPSGRSMLLPRKNWLKKVIQEDRVALFKQNYKDPEKFICVLVITPIGANLIYVPYSVSPSDKEEDAA